MRLVEDYWQDFIDFGFIKNESYARVDYTLPASLGTGGFTILGDTNTAMGIISDLTFSKPFVVLECVHEKIIDIGRFYQGEITAYKKKCDPLTLDYGLNAYVNHPFFYGYKRIEPHIQLTNIGFSFRKKFFDNLSITLPEDFWECAATSLNSATLNIPKITYICEQLRQCTLTGDALKLFIDAKALEVFAILYDYINNQQREQTIYLSQQDKQILSLIKKYLELNYEKNTTIAQLTSLFAINQQKVVTGFKATYHMTINGYRKKLRMSKALELLSNTDMPVAEIAKAVGYCGDGFFQKAFKDIYGVTPIEVRKSIK